MKKITKTIAAVMAAAMIAATASVAASAAKVFVITGDDFRAAYSTAGENIIDYVTFNKIENYELQFNFKLKNGTTKTYTAFSTHLRDTVAYIPMQDMLNKLKISAADIAEITVSGVSSDNVRNMSFKLER